MRARATVPLVIDATLSRTVDVPDGTPEESLRPMLQRDAEALVRAWPTLLANLIYEARVLGIELHCKGTIADVEFAL